MSHFTVLVVGDDVEKQLAPYHEFECTGDDNEFIQELDQTEEARAEYVREGNTTTMYKDTDGNLHSPYTEEGNYDPAYWRLPTAAELLKKPRFLSTSDESDGIRWASADWKDGRGYAERVFELPQGWTIVEVPESSVKSFADFCEDYYGHAIVPFGTEPDFADEHKYGYTLVNEKGEVTATIDRTNPNAKWDWYQVGGRWNGYFKLKDGTLGLMGKPGIQTMDKDYEPPKGNRADQCIKADIDLDGMRQEAADEAGETYDKVIAIIGDLPRPMSWEEVQVTCRTGELDEKGEPKVDWKKAREVYNSQPAVEALRNNQDTFWYEVDNFRVSREQYVERARNGALATFAVVKDGKWFERGEMGWWGIVRDEKDRDDWHIQFSLLIDGLPDNTLLTVVDCHI
jgi:hypothetical protein